MNEPSELDREMAKTLLLSLGEGAPWEWLDVFAKSLADARAEGAAEMRERCASIADDNAKLRNNTPYASGHFAACRGIAITIRGLK